MKRTTSLAVIVGLGMVLVASLAIAYTPGAGIKLSPHDLSSGGWVPVADPNQRICVYCHAPHFSLKPEDAATVGIDYYPLWNHEVTTLTYDAYQNTDPTAPVIPNMTAHQLNGGINGQIPGQPGGSSKLCLSCHDGSVAVGAYGFSPSSSIGGGTTFVQGAKLIGGVGASGNGDLRNSHPIGFSYDAVRAAGDDEIRDPSLTFVGSTVRIADVLYGDGSDPLAGKMECGTCHSVHNKKNSGQKLLWIEDTTSNLCLSCHLK
jgi:predicted CXXCH cytochrome family protein